MDRDKPLRLHRRSYTLRLFQFVRDEARRFAQHYHHPAAAEADAG